MATQVTFDPRDSQKELERKDKGMNPMTSFFGCIASVTVLLLTASAGCGVAEPSNAQAETSFSETKPVQLTDGPVIGRTEQGVHAFKGIPYAAPPGGNLRWKPPQAPAPWKEARKCFQFGAACPQVPNQLYKNQPGELVTSEDCLFLNVWTPTLDQTKKLPVMVWIHGGGNTSGSGHQRSYEGTNLARRDVVVVTINYRLGQFGYFAHPLLSNESETGTSGNYGLLDQIHALKWVQKNIAQFGGDANNVTIFGESAGGVNCTALMLSPLARGLFHRVVAQSGAVLMKRRFLKEDAGDMPSGHKGGVQLAKDLLGNADVTLAALRQISTETIVNSSRKTGALPGLPTDVRNIGVLIDGHVMPDDPYQMLAKGQFNRVPLMIGVNTDEGTVFTQRVRFFRSAGYRSMLGKFFPNDVERVAQLYPGESGREATQAFKKLLGDSMIVRPARKFADEVSKHDVPVYFYVFSRAPTFAVRTGLGAFHGLEIGYVFENLDRLNPRSFNDSDRKLSRSMSAYWREFAKTGTPQVEGLPTWPLYDEDKADYLELDESIQVKQRYRQRYYELLDKLTMQGFQDE